MDTLNTFEFLALGGIVATLIALAHILIQGPKIGNVAVAAALSAMFFSFSVVTIWADGILPVWTNHTTNLWGVQVWWDLLFAVGIALFLIAPRAKAVGMNMPLWVLLIASTASIALLAMCARLFWLERAAEEAKAAKPDPGAAKPAAKA
ncbi:MAG: hypothetical protein AAF697_08965 [Pseudomonadota bacterium]